MSNLWHVNADIELKVSSKYGKTIKKMRSHCFDRKSCRLDFGNVMKLREGISVDNQHLVNGEFQFIVIIRINSCAGIPSIELSDFLRPRNVDSEVVFFVDGRKLYIDAYAVIRCSAVFREVLITRNGEIIDEIEIKDAKIQHFTDFLRLLYQQKQLLTTDNIEGVLTLANRFKVEFLMADCEDFLISTNRISIEEKCRLAELYKFSNLEKKLITQKSRHQHQPTIQKRNQKLTFVDLHQKLHRLFVILTEPECRKPDLSAEIVEQKTGHDKLQLPHHQGVIEVLSYLDEYRHPRHQNEQFLKLQPLLIIQLVAENVVISQLIHQSTEQIHRQYEGLTELIDRVENRRTTPPLDHRAQESAQRCVIAKTAAHLFKNTIGKCYFVGGLMTTISAVQVTAQIAKFKYLAAKKSQAQQQFDEHVQQMLIQCSQKNIEFLNFLRITFTKAKQKRLVERRIEVIGALQEDQLESLVDYQQEYQSSDTDEAQMELISLLIGQTEVNMISLIETSSFLSTFNRNLKTTRNILDAFNKHFFA